MIVALSSSISVFCAFAPPLAAFEAEASVMGSVSDGVNIMSGLGRNRVRGGRSIPVLGMRAIC
jgi:hypothetical protein